MLPRRVRNDEFENPLLLLRPLPGKKPLGVPRQFEQACPAIQIVPVSAID